jgi:DNA segregation ATPase FtsK/SpoIIIE-like protein
VVGSLARANFPVRLVGQVTSPEEAKLATGYAGTGAERLRGPGDFIAVTGGQVTHFQGAFITARELAETVSQKLRAERGQWVQSRPTASRSTNPPLRRAPYRSRLRRVTDSVRRWLQGG